MRSGAHMTPHRNSLGSDGSCHQAVCGKPCLLVASAGGCALAARLLPICLHFWKGPWVGITARLSWKGICPSCLLNAFYQHFLANPDTGGVGR